MCPSRPILLATVITATTFAAGCSKPPPAAAAPPAFKVVGSSRDIMLAVTIPASDTVFNAAAEPPTTDVQWVSVARAALTLAESGNLLLLPGRAVDDGDWSRFAGMLIDTAAQATDASVPSVSEKRSQPTILSATDEPSR